MANKAAVVIGGLAIVGGAWWLLTKPAGGREALPPDDEEVVPVLDPAVVPSFVVTTSVNNPNTDPTYVVDRINLTVVLDPIYRIYAEGRVAVRVEAWFEEDGWAYPPLTVLIGSPILTVSFGTRILPGPGPYHIWARITFNGTEVVAEGLGAVVAFE